MRRWYPDRCRIAYLPGRTCHGINTCATCDSAAGPAASCKLCTISLEQLCYQRAWYFRGFRNTLAAVVHIWSWWHPVDPALYQPRAKVCHGCLRFRKNVLKEESRLFRWLDGYVNPVFNHVRDSLLSAEERETARRYAQSAAQGAVGNPPV